jgi:hypothetical protein
MKRIALIAPSYSLSFEDVTCAKLFLEKHNMQAVVPAD